MRKIRQSSDTIEECHRFSNMAQESTYNVKIVGLAELQSRLLRSPEVVEPILQQAIVKSAAILASHTVAGTIPWKTGTLARSFDPVNIDRLMARWFPRAEYARYVQDGTRPHWIEPTSGYLWWPGAPHPMARVFHPGTKPTNYMQAIRKASQNEINALFRNALTAIRDKMSGK